MASIDSYPGVVGVGLLMLLAGWQPLVVGSAGEQTNVGRTYVDEAYGFKVVLKTVEVTSVHSSGQERLTLRGHTLWVYGVAFSPDGKRLASGSY